MITTPTNAQIDTAEQLDALPVGSVVLATRDDNGDSIAYQKGPTGAWWGVATSRPLKPTAFRTVLAIATMRVLHTPSGHGTTPFNEVAS